MEEVPSTVEYNLKKVPYHGKLVVPPVRDQVRASTCSIHSSCTCVESLNKRKGALAKPQEDFEIILSADDLEMLYVKLYGPIGQETDKRSTGFRRLQRVLEIFANSGVCGTQAEEAYGPYKIQFFKEIQWAYRPRPTTRFPTPAPCLPSDVKDLFTRGHVLIGTFRISTNYRKLKPGEIYTYDKQYPALVDGQPCSHAVAMVGYGVSEEVWYYVYQNSYGEQWGENGIGRVNVDSISHLVYVRI